MARIGLDRQLAERPSNRHPDVFLGFLIQDDMARIDTDYIVDEHPLDAGVVMAGVLNLVECTNMASHETIKSGFIFHLPHQRVSHSFPPPNTTPDHGKLVAPFMCAHQHDLSLVAPIGLVLDDRTGRHDRARHDNLFPQTLHG